MSRPVRLALLLVALAVTISTQSLPTGETTARAAGATNVCTGVAGCRQVASADVDGDGHADQVGVAGRKLKTGGSITVRVRTATGRTVQTTGRHVFWYANPYVGAVALDGRKGAEIVVGDTMGAHSELFRVVTYRAGRLVTEAAPPYAWTRAGLKKSTPRWYIDGSYSFNYGAYRTVSAKGVVTLTMKSAERNLSGRGHTGHTTVYRWHAGAWQQVSTRTVRYSSDKAVFGLGGWHVKGLPRFVA